MLVHSNSAKKKPAFSLKPDFIATTVRDVDFAHLKNMGITTCFVDLDGTVVERGTFEVDSQLGAALRNSGLDIKIATNRPRSRSLQELEAQLSASGVVHPHGIFGKPTKRYIANALEDFGLQRHEVVMIGDRFIQDILGANRSGIYSLLVYKLGPSIGPFDAAISRMERKLTTRMVKSYRKV